MKNHHLRSVVAVCLVVSLLGCSMLKGRKTVPMTLEDVVRLSSEGETPEAIIEKLKESKTAVMLKSDQVIALTEQGVDSEVIDYMIVSYVERATRNAKWKAATVVAITAAITCLLCHAEKTDQHGQEEENAAITL
ncbi:MAG: hypothetical protein JRI70_01205 [Deltaproteobacteria bacterium]|nr:hypothetical protein [Deltaproteobacteria bacterium]MBW2171790.1 hypothetical protein [Deltaproteobacteria bacterium]MBW2259814.1 hypothetical protein [Deltaproteobacteria bacterium]